MHMFFFFFFFGAHTIGNMRSIDYKRESLDIFIRNAMPNKRIR